jgi:large subunit ribosomal protein L18
MRTLKRRRLEGKTDYKSRLALLASRKPRLVVRRTNRYIIAQIVVTSNAQDKVIYSITSKVFLTKGWPKEYKGSLKSLGASYLAGIMLGKIAKGKVKEATLDIGMHRSVPKARIYAVLKGFLEAGIKVPHDSSVLPTDEMLESNEKTRSLIKKLKEKI